MEATHRVLQLEKDVESDKLFSVAVTGWEMAAIWSLIDIYFVDKTSPNS